MSIRRFRRHIVRQGLTLRMAARSAGVASVRQACQPAEVRGAPGHVPPSYGWHSWASCCGIPHRWYGPGGGAPLDYV